VLTGQMAPFKAIKTTLNGDYKHLKEAWESAFKTIKVNGFIAKENGAMLEYYLNLPENTSNPADLKVEIYIEIE
jgi:effector-binding domain-containing protein